MNSNGDIREIPIHEQPRPDEIIVPAASVGEIRTWPRARRRAWYRKEAKRLAAAARPR